MTETFFVGNAYHPFNHFQLYQAHPATYELIARIWGSEIKPPSQDDSHAPAILDLRITATLMSQCGDFKGALQLIAEAEERDPDTEGRIASLRKSIEELRDKSNASTKSSAVESAQVEANRWTKMKESQPSVKASKGSTVLLGEGNQRDGKDFAKSLEDRQDPACEMTTMSFLQRGAD